LKATPLSAFTFLSAQIVSRYLLIIGSTIVVYLGSHFFIHYQMVGSYLDLFIVMSLGAICLITLGLLIAARTASEEFAGGILNLVSWPMMFMSGVWFSLEGAHPWVKKLALAFPLTHAIDASRAIMTEGATLMAVQGHVFALIAMSALFLLIGSLSFRWE
jgi:ABC-type multidrug transport system permease subunit